MKTNLSKKKRNRISRKKFEEKKIAEQNYSDNGTSLLEDPVRNNPEYYEEQGINLPEGIEEEKRNSGEV